MPTRKHLPDTSIHPTFHDDFRKSPVVLLDIGARGGIQSKWEHLIPHLSVVAFEPDPVEHASLSETAPPELKFLMITREKISVPF